MAAATLAFSVLGLARADEFEPAEGDLLGQIERLEQELLEKTQRISWLESQLAMLGGAESPEVETYGPPTAAFLGVRHVEAGARVVEVLEGSPAEAGGVEPGDLIVGIDDRYITSVNLGEVLTSRRPGDVVDVALLRDDAPLELTIQLMDADSWEARRDFLSHPCEFYDDHYDAERWLDLPARSSTGGFAEGYDFADDYDVLRSADDDVADTAPATEETDVDDASPARSIFSTGGDDDDTAALADTSARVETEESSTWPLTRHAQDAFRKLDELLTSAAVQEQIDRLVATFLSPTPATAEEPATDDDSSAPRVARSQFRSRTDAGATSTDAVTRTTPSAPGDDASRYEATPTRDTPTRDETPARAAGP